MIECCGFKIKMSLGSFQMDSKERNKNRDNKDTAGVHVFKVMFLVLFGLSFIYCITDPSIEMNPDSF